MITASSLVQNQVFDYQYYYYETGFTSSRCLTLDPETFHCVITTTKIKVDSE